MSTTTVSGVTTTAGGTVTTPAAQQQQQQQQSQVATEAQPAERVVTTRTVPTSTSRGLWITVAAITALALTTAAVVAILFGKHIWDSIVKPKTQPVSTTGFYTVAPVKPPSPPPSGGGGKVSYTTQNNVMTVGVQLANVGLSQEFADPNVGSFYGSAPTNDRCAEACTNNSRCVQYVYDTNATPFNPTWDPHGCWLRYEMPGPHDTTTAPGFVTGTKQTS